MSAIVRKAKDADIPILMDWLRAELDETGDGFYRNRNIIEDVHAKGMLTVVEAGGIPVGLLADSESEPYIVTVRPDLRGRGYGDLLAQHMIQSWRERGAAAITIECAPSESLTFWQRHGFKRCVGYGEVHAYLVLDKSFSLGDGPRVPYEIGYYPEERDWDTTIEPFITYRGDGEHLSDGSIQLAARATCFNPEASSMSDCVVRVEADGALLFEDKMKREEARALGIEDHGAFFMDRIIPATKQI